MVPNIIAPLVFAAGLFLLFYVYLGYPFLVTSFSRRRGGHHKPETYPRVSLVFCAHNEEAVLPGKIANCKTLNYPADLLEFCVGSDGSEDGTNALLQSWARDPRVRLEPRGEGGDRRRPDHGPGRP